MRWVRRAVELESGVWSSLFRWITRRPLPDGAFSYAQASAPLLWVFVDLSSTAIEIRFLRPTLTALPGGARELIGVCFHADDPRALLARVRELVG